MDDFEVLMFVKKIFAGYGITVESPRLETLERRPDLSTLFSDGSECHSLTFENAYIHFHVGTEQWKEHLPSDAPHIRIRHMEHLGKPIAESDWFSC